MKITMLLMGKSTILTWPFSIANCNKLPEGNYNVVIMYVYRRKFRSETSDNMDS